MQPKGFYTEEVRGESRRRSGFDLVQMATGARAPLARAGAGGPKVGRYGVDVEGFEMFLDSMELEGAGLIIIDEIGKMECLSARFSAFLIEALDSEAPVLATIALKGGGLIREVKERPDVQLFTLTRENRDTLDERILKEAFDG
jgi:nucleoside-triphosphatase